LNDLVKVPLSFSFSFSFSPGKDSGGATNNNPDSLFYLSDKHLAAKLLNLPLSFS